MESPTKRSTKKVKPQKVDSLKTLFDLKFFRNFLPLNNSGQMNIIKKNQGNIYQKTYISVSPEILSELKEIKGLLTILVEKIDKAS